MSERVNIIEMADRILAEQKKKLNGEDAPEAQDAAPQNRIVLSDLYAFLPKHNYIHAPTGQFLPPESVNSHVFPVKGQNGEIKPSAYLDQHRAILTLTWEPGKPQIIERPEARAFNLYRPPAIQAGNTANSTRWRDHLHCIYPGEGDHIERWLAHRVQAPGVKVNHALVLGGAEGIGKESILEPAKSGVGPHNWAETSPKAVMGQYTSYGKAVVVRISEAHDLGEFDRFAFHDRTKTLIAAPPDELTVNEKYIPEYKIPNVCGVVITTNHKIDGLYLPPGDRRHFVAWSDIAISEFPESYWRGYWEWLDGGGRWDVVEYLRNLDLSDFNPKAPPPRTEAWHAIVTAGVPVEESDLGSLLANKPDAITTIEIADMARARGLHDLAGDLTDRSRARRIPHLMDRAGFEPCRNPGATSGRWKVGGRDMAIYVPKGRTHRENCQAVERLIAASTRGKA